MVKTQDRLGQDIIQISLTSDKLVLKHVGPSGPGHHTDLSDVRQISPKQHRPERVHFQKNVAIRCQ